MANRDRTQNQSGQSQEGKPNPGAGRKGSETERERQDRSGGKGSARPSPNGVPNESKGTPGQPDSNDDRGRDDRDDFVSAGSLRGLESGKQALAPTSREAPDGDHGNSEHSGQQAGRHSDRDEDVNSMPSTKRHVPGGPDEDTRNPG